MAITSIVKEGLGAGVLLTNTNRFDDLVNLARKNSIHYLLFGLAC